LNTDTTLNDFCKQQKISLKQHDTWSKIRHTFTHFHLDIEPIAAFTNNINNHTEGQWFDLNQPINVGLAAPVKALITQLASTQLENIHE